MNRLVVPCVYLYVLLSEHDRWLYVLHIGTALACLAIVFWQRWNWAGFIGAFGVVGCSICALGLWKCGVGRERVEAP